VQFVVKDPDNVLRPGMFAEIGLGTDKRQALLVPADSVLHVGSRAFVLRSSESNDGGSGESSWPKWDIVAVQVGELKGSKVEVLSGLKAGERVIGAGAILLKPLVVQALEAKGTD
jgi:hypothetical protein